MVSEISVMDSDSYSLKFDNGFCLFVPANVRPSKPIKIKCVLDENNDTIVKCRNVVIMEPGSSADLLITYCTRSNKPCNYYDVTDITLGESATLNLVRMQQCNNTTSLYTSTNVQQSTCSRMKKHFVTMGGKKVHNSMKVEFSGAKAEHDAFGLSLTQQTGHVNNEIMITHASPFCRSSQLFKHILSDMSVGEFTGRIVVKKGAFKTMAFQRSNNILINPKAKMNICPQLEIYADDVKCSHGATVGQLDAEALFYMRSRGICETEAKKILLRAFANEAIDAISNKSFRENIRKQILC